MPAIHCRNYSADATAFVITYPIDSDPAKRSAALAWEAGFIQLANNELKNMAHAANLSFAFQAERSVLLVARYVSLAGAAAFLEFLGCVRAATLSHRENCHTQCRADPAAVA